jgi:hypothetical protein
MFQRVISAAVGATLGLSALGLSVLMAQPPDAKEPGGNRLQGGGQAHFAPKAPHNEPDPGLTQENFGALHSLIRPHAHEWRHLKVQWLTDVVAARKKAAAEDKPIVICYTGGAGYNEPLGVC